MIKRLFKVQILLDRTPQGLISILPIWNLLSFIYLTTLIICNSQDHDNTFLPEAKFSKIPVHEFLVEKKKKIDLKVRFILKDIEEMVNLIRGGSSFSVDSRTQ